MTRDRRIAALYTALYIACEMIPATQGDTEQISCIRIELWQMPFPNVPVFYGHIHQELHRTTSHITHHSAKSLMFPADRSWLVSAMWDDDWTCLGGPAGLVDRFLRHPDLKARSVTLDQDATPPGHEALARMR